jgi:hypothetical protein
LIRNVETLKDFIFHGEEKESQVTQSKFGGSVLRTLNELTVRKLCGEVIYGAGLQSYLQGRVSEKRFSSDTLSGKLDESGRKWLAGEEKQFFEPTITLERNKGSKKIHTYGYCGCNLATEGSLCPHMAALMVAWVRKYEEFEERVSEKDFESAQDRVDDSVRELANLVEKGGSSRYADQEVLQRTYSRLKLWTAGARAARKNGNQALIRDFSQTINYVSLALISAVESKYRVEATDLYNKNTVSTLGIVLDSLAKNVHQKKQREKKSRPRTSRSWDKLLDDFTGGSK